MGCFIVLFVEDGPISLDCKPGVYLCDCPQEFLFPSVLDWDQPNCICSVDVGEGNAGFPLVGRHLEATGIVTGDVACDNVYRHEDLMGANVSQLLGRVVDISRLQRYHTNILLVHLTKFRH